MPGQEASELVPLAIRVSDRLRRAVKARAALEGRPVQALVTQALTDYLTVHAEPASETETALEQTSCLVGESEVIRHSLAADGQGRQSSTEGVERAGAHAACRSAWRAVVQLEQGYPQPAGW